MVPQELAYKLDRLDAAKDGWDTEVLQQQAQSQLKALVALLLQPAVIEAGSLEELATEDVSGDELRPRALELVLARKDLEVRRLRDDGAPPARFEGRSGLARSLEELRRPYDDPTHLVEHLKLIRIDREDRDATTEIRFEGFGPAAGRPLQLTSYWQVRWLVPEDGPLRISGLEVASFDEVLGPAGGETLFADRTRRILGAEPCFEAQLLPGKRYWAGHLDVALGADILGHHGLAVGDVNGDGREDVYLAQAGGLPNKLLVQQEDGTVRDTAAAAGVDYLDKTTSALFVDFDNDGDQDLVTAAGPLIFHVNDGTGRFRVATALQTFLAMSLAAADYDGDGDLDLYVTRYSPPEETAPIPYHDAENGLPNVLLRNDGEFRFRDATEETGLSENNRRFSFAASWEDYDGDGDPDLYVANDFGRNNLYRNDGGRFRDVAGQAGVEDISAGMSVAWGDYDGDGDWDLYVSNMFSSAGNRIAYQRQFQEQAAQGVRGAFQRHARGNSLFTNAGDGTFRDVSVDAGVTMARWAWASKFVDFDNDGREDLYAVNGYVTNDDADDL
ncbi:MAG: VCBS repeat-containing protein [Acidobacteria bacterium]|nr:VCBS repeat-containing protein [Acidobacteriota bacterium]